MLCLSHTMAPEALLLLLMGLLKALLLLLVLDILAMQFVLPEAPLPEN